jgi:hypothetical protein
VLSAGPLEAKSVVAEKLAVCVRRPPVHQCKGRTAVASDSGGQGGGGEEWGLPVQSGSGGFEKPIRDRTILGWPEVVNQRRLCRGVVHRTAVSGWIKVRFIGVKGRPSWPEFSRRAFKATASDSKSHLRVATLAPDRTRGTVPLNHPPPCSGVSSGATTHSAARAACRRVSVAGRFSRTRGKACRPLLITQGN